MNKLRSGVAQRMGRGKALPLHDRGIRWRAWSAARSGRTLPKEKQRTHFTECWKGPKESLEGRKISFALGFDSEPPCPCSVTIYTELRSANIYMYIYPHIREYIRVCVRALLCEVVCVCVCVIIHFVQCFFV